MKHSYSKLILAQLLGAACVWLSSCYPGSVPTSPIYVDEERQKENLYYVPSTPNTPLLSEKNDFDFAIVRNSGEHFSGLDVQASYMAAQHVGLMLGWTLSNNNSYSIDNLMKYSRVEFGAGYVKDLSKTSHFETYAGLGAGKVHNFHYTGTSNINLTHFFIQPTIAVNNVKKTLQLAFVSKFTGVNFNVTDTAFNGSSESFSAGQLKSLYDDPFHIMWEPGLVLRSGWKNFQFNMGYSFSADLTNPDLHRSKGVFSIGVSARFNVNEAN